MSKAEIAFVVTGGGGFVSCACGSEWAEDGTQGHAWHLENCPDCDPEVETYVKEWRVNAAATQLLVGSFTYFRMSDGGRVLVASYTRGKPIDLVATSPWDVARGMG